MSLILIRCLFRYFACFSLVCVCFLIVELSVYVTLEFYIKYLFENLFSWPVSFSFIFLNAFSLGSHWECEDHRNMGHAPASMKPFSGCLFFTRPILPLRLQDQTSPTSLSE